MGEENIVEVIGDLAALVDITDDIEDQSQQNLDVVFNVLNVTNTIINGADLNDANLTKV